MYIYDEEIRIVFFDLFLYADGKKTQDEESLLWKLSKEVKVDDDDLKSIESYCEMALKKELELDNKTSFVDPTDYSQQVIRIMNNVINGVADYYELPDYFHFGHDYEKIFQKDQERAIIIWNLMNLGYADKEYSNPEKKVVDFLYKVWDVSKVIKAELEDTMNTIVLLYKEEYLLKEKVNNDSQKGYNSDIQTSLDKVEKDIERVKNSMELTLKALGDFQYKYIEEAF